MSKGNTFENDLLKLIFTGTTIANLAQNATSSPLTELFVSLHTANPDETGNQSTSECTYGDYERVSVSRATGSGGWVITNNSVSPVDDIVFPQASSGSETATHAAVGTLATGTGKILYKGALSPNIAISTGVTPTIASTSTITED